MAPAPIYHWAGFYIGGHVGGAFRGNDSNFGGFGVTGGNSSDGRFLGGVQVGGDYQFAGTNWVIGVEGQYSWFDRSSNIGLVFSAGPAAGFVFFMISALSPPYQAALAIRGVLPWSMPKAAMLIPITAIL